MNAPWAALPFEIAAGSVPGRAHARAGRPNQDAYAVTARGPCLAAVVADGCGSGARSEVGAVIGARLVAEAALTLLEAGAAPDAEELWEEVRGELLGVLGRVARAMGPDLGAVVADCFLFTVLAVAVSGERAAVVGAGDGVYAVGGELRQIGPFPGNAPPYLGYGLLGDGPRFTVHRALRAEELAPALIGTDGAADLGALSSFWTERHHFENRDALRRTLHRAGRETGLLEDDTTLVVIGRRELT